MSSNYHVELTPSDSGFQDRLVVQEVIKEIASSSPLETVQDQKGFKIVVLNEVDDLSKDAQHALRRTMEKYMNTCRLILCAQSSTKIIEAVRSRCLCLRIGAPSTTKIADILQTIAKKEVSFRFVC